MRFRFTIRDLLWLTALVALICIVARLAIIPAQRSERSSKIAALRTELQHVLTRRQLCKDDIEDWPKGENPEFRKFVEQNIKEYNNEIEQIGRELADLGAVGE